ncbi:MAG TPA: hypothetical protein VFU86_18170 [Terriglobales bacterium]|nr:hypothetical protein [Terriglobales bacterium]
MKAFKHIVNRLSKVIGGVAVAAFFFAPFTNTGLAVMAGAMATGLAWNPMRNIKIPVKYQLL